MQTFLDWIIEGKWNFPFIRAAAAVDWALVEYALRVCKQRNYVASTKNSELLPACDVNWLQFDYRCLRWLLAFNRWQIKPKSRPNKTLILVNFQVTKGIL